MAKCRLCKKSKEIYKDGLCKECYLYLNAEGTICQDCKKNVVVAKGRCQNCYRKWRRQEDPEFAEKQRESYRRYYRKQLEENPDEFKQKRKESHLKWRKKQAKKKARKKQKRGKKNDQKGKDSLSDMQDKVR